jgi:hypothetical protein
MINDITQQLTLQAIAKVCHQANKAWCEAQGDDSQLDWDNAPEWQRSSAIYGVAFALCNPDAGDSAMHDSWADQKVAEGWVYGAEKNVDLKTHPCLVPFYQLPQHQQKKDRLFRSIVNALK